LKYTEKSFTEFISNYQKNNTSLTPKIYRYDPKLFDTFKNNSADLSEINSLKIQLDNEKSKNAQLILENNFLNNLITELKKKNKIQKEKIELLENILQQNNIPLPKNSQNDELNDKGKILAINFVSMGSQDIGHYNIICKTTDLFVRVEERLYEDFPQFKEFDNYFQVKTRRIKRFKTIEENNIQNNDLVNIFIIDN